ncbi:MAG: aminotransferase class IV [Deltaproteobacteria bacterium]|nr:aminotransferase class IV [Deltaproteobacteria bacterium]
MLEDLQVWVNGNLIPWSQATVHMMSHSFSRGSAMFDVFGIHRGKEGPVAFRMDKHLDRFYRSVELLEMRTNYTRDELKQAVAKVVKANKIGRGVVRITGYYSEQTIVTLVMDQDLDIAIFAIPETEDFKLNHAEPIRVCISKWRKLHPATVPVEAKACANYLNGMLSRKDAAERGFDLAIMLTTDGYVAVQSITRLSIIEATPSIGIQVREEQIVPQELLDADEIFTCHTGTKVTPVKQIEDRILRDVPGPVTSKIFRLMEDIINFRNKDFEHWFEPL